MSNEERQTTIKAELNVLKDTEKSIKWSFIKLRSAEEHYNNGALSEDEFLAVKSVFERAINEHREIELAVIKRIAKLERGIKF